MYEKRFDKNNVSYSDKNDPSKHYEAKALFEPSQLNKQNYVEMAEKVIQHHSSNHQKTNNNSKTTISTSQIRNLLDLLNVLRERLRTMHISELTPDLISQIQYIKLRFIYAAGRDNDNKGIRDFIIKSSLIECVDSIGNSVEQFQLVCNYMEALVAYHKYYIGEK